MTISGPDQEHVEELIGLDIDGELPEEHVAAYKAHIAGCERCRGARTHYAAMQRALTMSDPDVEMQRGRSLAVVRARVRPRTFPLSRVAMAIAAVLVLFVIGAVGTHAVDRLFVPERAAQSPLAFADGEAELVVETGRTPVMLGGRSAVAVIARVSFSDERSGRLLLMVSEPGGPPATIGEAILSRTRRVSLEGNLPDAGPDSQRSHRVWIRLETDGTVTESQPVTVRISRSGGRTGAEIQGR